MTGSAVAVRKCCDDELSCVDHVDGELRRILKNNIEHGGLVY